MLTGEVVSLLGAYSLSAALDYVSPTFQASRHTHEVHPLLLQWHDVQATAITQHCKASHKALLYPDGMHNKQRMEPNLAVNL